MFTFIAKLVVAEGREAEFERLQTELSALTHENEPDCLVYDVIRHQAHPRSYIVYARFTDEAAFQQASGHRLSWAAGAPYPGLPGRRDGPAVLSLGRLICCKHHQHIARHVKVNAVAGGHIDLAIGNDGACPATH